MPVYSVHLTHSYPMIHGLPWFSLKGPLKTVDHVKQADTHLSGLHASKRNITFKLS